MKSVIKIITLFLLFILTDSSLFAQERIVTGKVVDAKTKLPLSSCSVYSLHSGNGVITDEDGSYVLTVSDRIDSIAFSMVGYSPQIKKVSQAKNQIINFEAEISSGSMQEVSISAKSKYTRAQRLVRLVIKNKDKHNVYQNNNFQTKVYDKIELDIKNISEKIQNNKLLKPLRFILNNMDSTTDKQKYLPVYLSESIADFYYKRKPEKERYEYTAIKSSGLDNESLLTYIDGLYKKINVYDNLIKLVDINFVSPIADNALSFYNYHINDTMMIDGHQCIQVQFSQIQYGTNTFNGFMWIVDTTYAIKSMTMHMDKSASINFVNKFEITQNFELNDDKFLPSKNILFIDLNIPAMKKMGVIAKKTTLFQKFILNQPSFDSIFSKPLQGIATVHAKDIDSSYWNTNRFEPLTKTENSVYKLMDTLNKIPAVITYGKIIDVLSSGYYNLGKIDIGNLYGTYYNDRVEGDRFNAGFRTHSTFSDKFRLKGYLGYSTKDKKFRYSLGTLFVLNKKQWSVLNIVYSNDIVSSYNNNNDEIDQTSIFGTLLRRIKSSEIRLVNNRELNINYKKFFANGFGINAQARSSTLTPYFNVFFTHDKFVPFITAKEEYNSYKTNEVALTLRYVYKEKFVTEHFRRGSLGSNYPIVNLTYTRGFKIDNGLFKSDFNYNRWNINVQHDFSDGRLGQLSYTLQAGITKGILPILLLDVQKGNDTYYYNMYAFNNMNRYEFVADKYASLSVEQNFGSFPFNHIPAIKKLKWRSLATFKGVIGSMTEENKIANGFYDNTIDYHFTVPAKTPYMEAGVGIENIFKLLRIDAIWRLNYLQNKNVPAFGILGSIQFKF
ncbi:MAG: DUF5686 and carboxypeptidase regulatory-like domain-containing protein [Bacteroidota bacterium]|nr:DUF5686 and carboxypeptidase regulatory-like domain-containing protein [Bacteroidota bacterium]